MIEPAGTTMDEMTDEELDAFADSLFDQVQAHWKKDK